MKAAIIGTSGHIDLALGVRDRLPQLSFVGIAPGSADEDAREFYVDQLEPSLIPFYEDYRRMLDREKPQIVVVAPFFFLQSRIACECLERGMHVFVEKPMAVTLEQLDRLRRAHALGKAALCPMLSYRYNPAFHAAWRAVKEGLIGEPMLISGAEILQAGQPSPAVHAPRHLRRHDPLGGHPRHGLDPLAHRREDHRGGRQPYHGGKPGPRGDGKLGGLLLQACQLGLRHPRSSTISVPAPPLATGTIGCGSPANGASSRWPEGEATLLCHERPPCRLEKEEPLSLFEEFVRHLEQGTPMRITAEEAFAVSELALRSREAADTKTTIKLGKAQ